MKNTRFFYSICYPDQEEIEYIEQPIDEAALLSLFQTFDWQTELRKPMDFYSPSLDFVGASDKHRFILSGLGEGELEAYMAMYIVPKDEACSEPFDDRNYFRADTYTAEVSLPAADLLIDFFLRGDYSQIRKLLSQEVSMAPAAPVEGQKVETVTPEEVIYAKPETGPPAFWERVVIRQIKEEGTDTEDPDFWNQPEWTLVKIGQRLLAYGLFLLFILVSILTIGDGIQRGDVGQVLGGLTVLVGPWFIAQTFIKSGLISL